MSVAASSTIACPITRIGAKLDRYCACAGQEGRCITADVYRLRDQAWVIAR